MKEKQFIRVEHLETKRGMYGMGDSNTMGIYDFVEFQDMVIRYEQNLKPFWKDEILSKYFDEHLWHISDWRFCFSSFESFDRMITRIDVVRLKDRGYRVYSIKSNKYVISDNQAIFDINSVISKEDITELFI